MKKITINLEPPYIILGQNGCSDPHSCTMQQLRHILSVLGSNRWPLKDCVIKAELAEDDPRFYVLFDLLISEPSRQFKPDQVRNSNSMAA